MLGEVVGRVMDIPSEKTFPKNRRNFCFELMLPFALKTRNFRFFSGTIYKITMPLIRKWKNMHLKILFIIYSAFQRNCNFNPIYIQLWFLITILYLQVIFTRNNSKVRKLLTFQVNLFLNGRKRKNICTHHAQWINYLTFK